MIFKLIRLWNATLLQNFPKVDSVKIASRAKIHIPSEWAFQQDLSNDEFEVSVICYRKNFAKLFCF